MRLVSALSVVLAATLVACAPSPATTRIERGEKVTTGDEAFDSFFRDVAEVKAEAEKAGTEAADAEKPLSDATGSQGKGTSSADVVRAEAKKLQMSGTLLHLDLVPEAKLTSSAKPEGASEKILSAAEQAAKGSVAVARRVSELLVRVGDLERRRADLVEKAKTSFTDADKRKAVSLELVAAANVLEAVRQTGEKHAGKASRLAIDLAVALETGAGSGAAGKKPPVKGGGKPGGTGVTAPAKPKGDDFDR